MGATHESVTCPLKADVPVTAVGAEGTAVPGVTGALAPDGFEDELTLVAVTVHVYVAPDVREGTTTGDPLPVLVPVTPPLAEVQVAVKIVTGKPDTAAPGVNATETLVELAAVAGPIVGTAGAPLVAVGVTGVETLLAGDSPTSLTALTVAVYAVPFVNPVARHDVAGAATVQSTAPPD